MSTSIRSQSVAAASLHLDDLLRAVPGVAQAAEVVGLQTDEVLAVLLDDFDDYLARTLEPAERESEDVAGFRHEAATRLADALR